jgi:hypothetical protein
VVLYLVLTTLADEWHSAVNEIQPVGNLQSFIVGSDGGLTLVDTVSTGGNGPTFTNPLSTGEVTGMNVSSFHTFLGVALKEGKKFGSPDSALVATVPGDPLHFQKNSPVVEFPVNGGPSNPHMSLEFNGEVFISDFVSNFDLLSPVFTPTNLTGSRQNLETCQGWRTRQF